MSDRTSASSTPPPRHRWRAYHALALLPTIGMLGGIFFANRVHPLVFGLPFLFAWFLGWVLATSLIMECILLLDRAHERVQPEEERLLDDPAKAS